MEYYARKFLSNNKEVMKDRRKLAAFLHVLRSRYNLTQVELARQMGFASILDGLEIEELRIS